MTKDKNKGQTYPCKPGKMKKYTFFQMGQINYNTVVHERKGGKR